MNLLMFGGEFYDGKRDKMLVYNNLYLYHSGKNTWTQITSPNGCVPSTLTWAKSHASLLVFSRPYDMLCMSLGS
jgi:N-acetylneuraminic acid mutarotase